MAQGVACKKNLDTNEAYSISLDTHIKRLEKKTPDIVIPFVVRVIILAFICFFFFSTKKTATKNIHLSVPQYPHSRIVLKCYYSYDYN